MEELDSAASPVAQLSEIEAKREARRAYQREWREKNKERLRESERIKSARWRERNPEKYSQVKSTYQKALADKRRLDPQFDKEFREKKRSSDATYYQKNREKIIEKVSTQYLENPAPVKLRAKQWKSANRERARENNAAWAEANPEKDRLSKIKWKKANPENACAYTRRRVAKKLSATPAWADDDVIKEIYELSALRTRLTGVKHHVDHIVPLISKIVCGLHCEQNLRVVTAFENYRKNNRHWPDMPN